MKACIEEEAAQAAQAAPAQAAAQAAEQEAEQEGEQKGEQEAKHGKAQNSSAQNAQNVEPDAKPTQPSKKLAVRFASSDGSLITFSIKDSMLMRKLMDAYEKKRGVDAGVFKYTLNGEIINPDSTIADVGIQDNDQIDAMMAQTGGGYRAWFTVHFQVANVNGTPALVLDGKSVATNGHWSYLDAVKEAMARDPDIRIEAPSTKSLILDTAVAPASTRAGSGRYLEELVKLLDDSGINVIMVRDALKLEHCVGVMRRVIN
jgi:small ubiquitin-related modifier